MPETLPNWILTYALHSTLLGLIALGFAQKIRRADHRALALRMALFGALLSATLPFQWTPAVPGLVGQRTAASEARAVSLTGSTAGATGPALVMADVAAADASTGGSSAAKPGFASAGFFSANWSFWIAGLLLAVSAIRLLRLEYTRRRFVRGLARVALHDASSQAKLNAWAAAEGRAPVRLSQSPYATSPLALPGHEICVPTGSWDELSLGDREAVLAHEFAHLLRRDPFWFALAAAVERAFWFLPLHGLLRRRASVATELACDDAAARRVGSALKVARGLAAVASNGANSAPVPALIPAMATSKSQLVARVESLLENADRPGGDAPSQVGAKRFYVGLALSAFAFACGAPKVGDGDSARGVAPAEMASGSDMLVAELNSSGFATLRAEDGRSTETSLSTREGRAVLRAWLESETAEAPRGGPELLDERDRAHGMATSMPLLVRADGSTPFKFVQVAMEQCAAPSVQLWDIRLQSDAASGTSIPIPLPVDVGVGSHLASSSDPEYRVQIRLDPADTGGGSHYTVSVSPQFGGPFGWPLEELEEVEEGQEAEEVPVANPLPEPKKFDTLPEVRAHLQALGKRYDFVTGTIDARRGTTVGDVRPVLDLLMEAGIQSIQFIGSYER